MSLESISRLIRRRFGGEDVSVHAFGVDEGDADSTEKGIGYGKPVRISFTDGGGEKRVVVLHTGVADHFGHDRRADRAGDMLLAFDTFSEIPRHVRPLDVGYISDDGALTSVADSGEFYLLTEFAPGSIYADDLRTVAKRRSATERDRLRCDALVDALVDIHAQRGGPPFLYTRSIRDLVGGGDGIFGLIDDFASDVPAAPPERLRAIERRCLEWRWKLRGNEERVARIHGDFHPFNIIFDDSDTLSLLDASRGCHGDPADDVACLALNYLFFSAGHPGAWRGLGELWRRFWRGYLERTSDHELLRVAPPFIAWRALVMADPTWYPLVSAGTRDALLSLVESALDAGRFDPDSVETLFAADAE